MKYILIASLCLLGCTSNAQTSEKPSGERVLASLFDGASVVLSTEPLCNMVSVSLNKKDIQLKDHLASVLATSYESENVTTVTTSCSDSKYQSRNDEVIDIWDCMLVVNETSSSGEFISSSTIAFGLNKQDLVLLPNSLRCF
jgi:hypothetical protein